MADPLVIVKGLAIMVNVVRCHYVHPITAETVGCAQYPMADPRVIVKERDIMVNAARSRCAHLITAGTTEFAQW